MEEDYDFTHNNMDNPIEEAVNNSIQDNMETLTQYEDMTATPYEDNEIDNPEELQPNKRRKRKSIVWEHFTIEVVDDNCRKACCNNCKKLFAYSTGAKVSGTSHVRRHIAKGSCQALVPNQTTNHELSTPNTLQSPRSGSNSSITPAKQRYRTPSTSQLMFDPDRCRHEIARMIIMHDYPLHMVEHPGFVAFVQNLQPQFNMLSFNAVQGDCVATYLMEKQNLIKFIEGIPGRVCLTLDMWTSSQSVGYVFITGHFIDADWNLQRRLLNVVMEPYAADSPTVLGHAVAVCLHDWNLGNKLFSITYDHPSISDQAAAIENLRPFLSVKNPLILNGQLLVGNCAAQTLSGIAKDILLGAGRDIVDKIRGSVKYVKTSESNEEKFLYLKNQLRVPSERILFLDDQTQWNTTYQMLLAACELKEVFSFLDTWDSDYKQAPSTEDWKQVETICTYLRLIFDAANRVTLNPTAVTFFPEVGRIQTGLARMAVGHEEDPLVSSLTTIAQERIGSYCKNCSLVLATSVVMDPRYKMKYVEFSFKQIYGEEAPTYVKMVDDGIHELCHEYITSVLPLPLTPTYSYAEEENGSEGTLVSDTGLINDFDMYVILTSNHNMKSELDQYLQ